MHCKRAIGLGVGVACVGVALTMLTIGYRAPADSDYWVWAGLGWRKPVTYSDASRRSLDTLGLAVALRSDAEQCWSEFSRLASSFGVLQLGLIEAKANGFLVFHVGGGENEVRPRCELVHHDPDQSVLGWRVARLLIETGYSEHWLSEMCYKDFGLGSIYREGDGVHVAVISRKPAELRTNEIPILPIGRESIAQIRSVAQQGVTDAVKWTPETWLMEHCIVGEFRQVVVLGRDENGGRFGESDSIPVARFVAESVDLIGDPVDKSIDRKTRAIFMSTAGIERRRPKLSILFLIRNGVRLVVEGKEVNASIELVWDAVTEKMRLGECK